MVDFRRIFTGAPGAFPGLAGSLPLVAPSISARIAALTDSAAIAVDAAVAGTFSLTCVSNAARAIQVPTNGRRGAQLVVRIINASGGNLTATTFTAAIRQPALTLPANGFERDYQLVFDGTSWAVSGFSPIDVPASVVPPPVLPTLVFNSQWANSLGNSATAFRDGTNFDATVIGTGGQSAVETAASLGIVDWPVANVWTNRANGVDWQNTTQVQWDLGTPAPGDHRWFRHYYQCPIPNTVTPDGAPPNLEHGHETADAALGGGDGYAPIRLPKTDSTWFFGYREISTGFRYYWNSTFLQKFTTYRIEWDILYGVGTYTLGVKVWNASDVLLLDSSDPAMGGDLFSQYLPVNNPALFLRNQVFTLADFADHRYLRFGNNGPNGASFPSVGVVAGTPMHYYGAAAVSFTSSCGPYVAGNG